MKQFCGTIGECTFSGDLICVFCGRRIPKSYIPEDEDEHEEAKKKGLESFYDEYDVDPFETKPQGEEKSLKT